MRKCVIRNILQSALLAWLLLALGACEGSDSGSSQGRSAATSSPAPAQTSQSTPPRPDSYSWMQPTQRRAAYLGDDGGGSSTGTVCDSSDEYLAWLNSNSSSGCNHYNHGIPVVIDKTISESSQHTLPLVRIHAADSSWSGYTELLTLRPAIPKGTVIYFKREGNETLRLASTQQSDDGPNLGDNVIAMGWAPSCSHGFLWRWGSFVEAQELLGSAIAERAVGMIAVVGCSPMIRTVTR
jgi:hypothetical protein